MSRPRVRIRWRVDGRDADPGCVAIVVDVLRASTTITTLFSRGAREVAVTREIEDARKIAADNDYLLIGERNNRIIDGFDYSSSPSVLQHEDITGRGVAFTSTNFPHALHQARAAEHVLVGAVVNVTATAERAFDLARGGGSDICIMLAGEPVEPRAFEDRYFAGLASAVLAGRCKLDDAARLAAAEVVDLSAAEAALCSKHAAELIDDGLNADVEFAFTRDRFEIVPILRDGLIRRQ
ncbi:MAG: 2-phosphosulfolactate phosphatase [Phycisphaerales bacterium]|nr:MAG: 2-phosphosulfolactate phosphatase [Phycisphaerales bacterium]